MTHSCPTRRSSELLCECRRKGKDGRRPRQRSGLAAAAGAGRFRGPGDDLLRPLDLQVRGGGPAGRRRRVHRPRYRARVPWLECGDRTSVVEGKSVSVRVGLGGGRSIKTKTVKGQLEKSKRKRIVCR